ncbi:MAG: DUF1697 domain-containing protein [Nocardioides sp.]
MARTRYAAFLRAINLGPTRKFPKTDIVAATRAAGGEDVETYINTGNVRLTSSLESREEVEQVLEAAYLADRGFPVPTIAFTLVELAEIAERAAEIEAVSSPAGEYRHYVSLLKSPPTSDGIETVEAWSTDVDVVVARERAVHLLLSTAYHAAKLDNAAIERVLGVATNRNLTVIRALTRRWPAH